MCEAKANAQPDTVQNQTISGAFPAFPSCPETPGRLSPEQPGSRCGFKASSTLVNRGFGSRMLPAPDSELLTGQSPNFSVLALRPGPALAALSLLWPAAQACVCFLPQPSRSAKLVTHSHHSFLSD